MYYSRTGNTKFVAEKITDQLDADLCEVTDKKNRKGKLIFLTGGYAAIRQKLTEIQVDKPIEDYGLIIIGSPVWAGKIPPATRTFLVKNNFSNKQVAFFITLSGDKPEKTLRNMKETIKPILPITELAIKTALEKPEQAQEQVSEWCNKIQKTF